VKDDLVATDLDVILVEQVLGYPALFVRTHRLQQLAAIPFYRVKVDADARGLLAV